MKTKHPKNLIQSINTTRIAMIVGLILLIPLWGNYYVDGWNWSVGDFIFAAIFIFTAGFILEFTAKKLTNPVYKALACIAIIVVFVLIWIELAVGIFGTLFAGS